MGYLVAATEVPPMRKESKLARMCEFWKSEYINGPNAHLSVEICDLTGKPCFVLEPYTAEGRALIHSCHRRLYALDQANLQPEDYRLQESDKHKDR
jgi:hypothetical protein